MKNVGIIKLYCGESGKIGYYNSQEIGEAKALAKRNYNVFVFICDQNIKKIEEQILNGIKIIKCPGKALGIHGRFDWSILNTYKIDTVQINSDNQLFAKNLVEYCKCNNIDYYCYIGSIRSMNKGVIKKMISYLLFKRAISLYRKSTCFCKTQDIYECLYKNNINKLYLAPVGLDIDIIANVEDSKLVVKERLSIPIDKKIVMFVGRMEEYKKPYEFIKLLQSLDDDCYGICIGNGILSNSFDQEIEKRELHNKIKHINAIENSKINEYYYISDYFVNFNRNEIFGMSILESMYQGCNVIAYSAPGPNTIIKDKVNGFIVDDIDSMIRIIKNNVKCNEETIKENVISNFTWDKTVSAILKIIEE